MIKLLVCYIGLVCAHEKLDVAQEEFHYLVMEMTDKEKETKT